MFKTREEAVEALREEYGEDLEEGEIVYVIDDDGFVHSDNAIACHGCGDHYHHRSSLDDDLLCTDCAGFVREDREHVRQLRSDYFASAL